jgi:UDP-4-amino-4,6-dideoxy-N-acetyl-beta-L-altrosamine N-acetyltransferase
VLGETAPWLDRVRAAAAQAPFRCELRVGVKDMAALLADVDLAIGAAGQSALERCCLGVPSIVVVLAANQEAGARALAGEGAALVLGAVDRIEPGLPVALDALETDDALQAMSRRSAAVTDGAGIARVLAALGLPAPSDARLRPMTGADLAMVLAWRNDSSIRQHMYSTAPIALEEPAAWFERSRREAGRQLLILEVAGHPAGFVNLSPADANGSAEWGFYAAPGAPRGTGALLGREALQLAFGGAGLRELRGEVLESNTASANFHLRLGFRQVGAPVEKYVSGRTCGTILRYALRKEDYRP